MLKKLLIGAGVVLALLAVVAVGLVLFFDVNRFKPTLIQALQDRYQRTLVIDGDLKLSVFPRLAIQLPAMTLSEPGAAAIAARIGSARVAVGLVPLLGGRIEADRLSLDGLDARIRRLPDGRLSIDDLLGTATEPSPPTSPGPSVPPGPAKPAERPGQGGAVAIPALDIGGLTITQARVSWEDVASGQVTTLDGLTLESGRIASGEAIPIDLAFRLTSTEPALALQTRLTATLQWPGDASRPWAIERLELGVDGTRAGQAIRARLQSTRFELAQGSRVAGPLALNLQLSVPTADATAKSEPRRLALALEGPLNGDAGKGHWRFGPFKGALSVDDARLTPPSTRLDLTGELAALADAETANANLQAGLGDETLRVKVDLKGFERPELDILAEADRLDLDRWLAAASAGAGAGPEAGKGANSKGAAGAATTGSSAAKSASAPNAPNAPEVPLDLTALEAVNGKARLRVGELRGRGLVASQLAADLRLNKGLLEVQPLSAQLYQGKLAGSLGVRAGSNQTKADLQLSGVSIGPLLKALADKDLLEGRGNVRLALTSAGPSIPALTRGLNGQIALQLADGSIKGINLAESFRNARQMLQGGGTQAAADASRKTDFTSLAVSFDVRNGIASSHDLDVRSALLRLGGEGRIDLPGERIDYLVRASVVGTTTGQGGKDLEQLHGVTVPVQLVGPLASPDWRIDWATAGREVLKSRAGAELKERLKTDQLEGKARERLDDALRGLFRQR